MQKMIMTAYLLMASAMSLHGAMVTSKTRSFANIIRRLPQHQPSRFFAAHNPPKINNEFAVVMFGGIAGGMPGQLIGGLIATTADLAPQVGQIGGGGLGTYTALRALGMQPKKALFYAGCFSGGVVLSMSSRINDGN